MEVVFGRIENIFGNGENSGIQHFRIFPQFFSEFFFRKVVKSQDCVVKCYDTNVVTAYRVERGVTYYLAKWRDLNYDMATWEPEDSEVPDFKLHVENYENLR